MLAAAYRGNVWNQICLKRLHIRCDIGSTRRQLEHQREGVKHGYCASLACSRASRTRSRYLLSLRTEPPCQTCRTAPSSSPVSGEEIGRASGRERGGKNVK